MSEGVEALYPFLYDGAGDIDAVLEQVARSTAERLCWKAIAPSALRNEAAGADV